MPPQDLPDDTRVWTALPTLPSLSFVLVAVLSSTGEPLANGEVARSWASPVVEA